MKFHLVYLIIALLFLGTSCSKEKEKISIVEEESLEMQMIKAYNAQFKTNYICLMPCNLFGPNDNYDLKNSHFIIFMYK